MYIYKYILYIYIYTYLYKNVHLPWCSYFKLFWWAMSSTFSFLQLSWWVQWPGPLQPVQEASKGEGWQKSLYLDRICPSDCLRFGLMQKTAWQMNAEIHDHDIILHHFTIQAKLENKLRSLVIHKDDPIIVSTEPCREPYGPWRWHGERNGQGFDAADFPNEPL